MYSVSAIFNLLDNLSGPLRRIRAGLKETDGETGGLSARMGQLASSMLPVIAVLTAVTGLLGGAVTKAVAFEGAMADVAKVVNFDSPQELQGMSDTVLELSGRIPMAADGLAAIIAAAGQSGVAKDDLVSFAEQAAKMGVAFGMTGDQSGKMMSDWRAGMGLTLDRTYALADAVNHLSNNMNAAAPALGEVLQRTGPLALQTGLAETQVAALGAAFLSAGAGPEIASTALSKFVSTLVKGAAMSKDQATAFKSLGLSSTQMAKDMQHDAQGTIFQVLEALSRKPKELQVSLLTEMFGEESIKAIAPLLGNMDNLRKAFTLTGNATNYAESMQGEFDTRARTTGNTLTLLWNKISSLGITVGNIFLPAISWGARAVGALADGLRALSQNTVGQWIVGLMGGVVAVAAALASAAAGAWAFGAVLPALKLMLTPLIGAIAAVGAPVWIIVGAVAALYLAWRNNFGGMADALAGAWERICLVWDGLRAVFSSLVGGVGEIKGELAERIEAAGLVGLVTTIGRVIFRLRAFFGGMADAASSAGDILGTAFAPVVSILGRVFGVIGGIIGRIAGAFGAAGAETGVSSWRTLGTLLGGVLVKSLELFAQALQLVLMPLEVLSIGVAWLVGLFTGAGPTASQAGEEILGVFNRVFQALTGINLFESGAKLIRTFLDGITSGAQALVDGVTGVFSQVRQLLPFSDAKAGPFSQLTASGQAILATLGKGVASAQPVFAAALSDAFGAASAVLTPDMAIGAELMATPQDAAAGADGQRGQGRGEARIIIQNLTLTLPDVQDAQGLAEGLSRLVEQYDV